MSNPITEAVSDITDGLKLAPLWTSLGWDQTLARFRRTVLGPFWLTANLLAISFSRSVVFGGLMGTDYRATFALVVSGVLSWSLIGGPLGESAGLFMSSAGTMMSQKLPLSFYVFLMMYRTCINFVAQLLALWVVLLVLRLGAPPSWQILFGLPITVCTITMMGLVVAFPSARFRDLGQLVGSIVQLLFFITPVIWAPINMTHRQRIMAQYNPFAHLLAIVREPLLGHAPSMNDWTWAISTLIISTVAAIAVLSLYRKRVIFWL
jgi:ABC-2 type transport system permease protein/lipopolysaccharide transport system permease protein